MSYSQNTVGQDAAVPMNLRVHAAQHEDTADQLRIRLEAVLSRLRIAGPKAVEVGPRGNNPEPVPPLATILERTGRILGDCSRLLSELEELT